MDLELLHKMCKEDTRKAFNEFKRVIDVELFAFNDNVRKDLQNELTQGLCKRAINHFVTSYKLSDIQIQFLCNTTNYYKDIVLHTSNNYYKRFL